MRNMKYLPWIVTILPLAAVALFMTFRSPSAPPPATMTATKSQPFKKQENTPQNHTADGSRIKPLPPGEVEARQRLSEATKVADASRARSVEASRKVGEMHTPEYCNQFADRIMQKREPGYRKIFDAWNLGTDTSEQVLSILHEREFRQAENRGKYMRNSAPLGSGKVHQFNQQTEDLVANEQLALLLGKTRASEVIEAANRMQAEGIRDALSAAGLPTARPK